MAHWALHKIWLAKLDTEQTARAELTVDSTAVMMMTVSKVIAFPPFRGLVVED